MSLDNTRTTPGLIGDLIGQVTELFRKELRLFRAEMDEKATQAATAVGLIAASLIVALAALNVLSAALVAAVTELGLSVGWASLIVGGALALTAFAFAAKGVKDLKAGRLAPEKTARALSEDAALAKETIK